MFSSNTSAVSNDVNYIEDVFSTWLYTGNGSTQTITNGIDLSGKGGLVWIKRRTNSYGHRFVDTVRGATKSLQSNSTAAEATESTGLTSFNSTGFALGADLSYNDSTIYASWAFREQAKFFDVVTYTGTGANRTVAHSLGSVPGCILVKRTDTTADWQVYHRSLANTEYLVLNTTAAKATGATRWNSTTPTSTEFSLGTDTTVNASGGTYVAYLFAHDAGGFGQTGSDNVISCGTYTTDGSGNATITLGYEPQWILSKKVTGTADGWWMYDNMRGLVVGPGLAGQGRYFYANTNQAEGNADIFAPTATGFRHQGYQASSTFIYIAIRRGPMKTPTTGTSVFTPTVYTGTNVDNRLVNTTIAPDMVWVRQRDDTTLGGMVVGDRLRGQTTALGQPYLLTGVTDAEVSSDTAFDTQVVSTTSFGLTFSSMSGFWCGTNATAKLNVNTTSNNHVVEAFKRAPGFFDIVCYTGTGSATTQTHNLGVAPEMMILKRRNSASGTWAVYANNDNTDYLVLNTNAATVDDNTYWNDTSPTSSVFSIGTNASTNASGGTYVAYLFATLAGISKVGSYTGSGTTKQIDCGFTGGARFVLIKRTDTTGDWYVWDNARGIVSGNDPYLLLNSTAAEVTSTDYVDTYSAGFEISSTAPAAINANGGNFIFLAIA